MDDSIFDVLLHKYLLVSSKENIISMTFTEVLRDFIDYSDLEVKK